MAYVSLSGGLGNQLFQTFFALYLNQIHPSQVILDDSRQECIEEHANSRLCELIPLGERIKVAKKIGGLEMGLRAYEMISKETMLGKKFPLQDSIRTYTESKYVPGQDDWRVFESQLFRRYVGYFQTCHFYAALEEITKRGIRDSILESMKSVESKYADPEIVVHMRLGDYRFRKDLILLEEEYYLRALQSFERGKIRGLIITDEPNSEEVESLSQATGLEVARNLSPIQSLGLLVMAESKIIANSTLSFAGALISEQTKTIVAPDSWGYGKNLQFYRNGAYPSNWIITKI